jgi:hypothetical protein
MRTPLALTTLLAASVPTALSFSSRPISLGSCRDIRARSIGPTSSPSLAPLHSRTHSGVRGLNAFGGGAEIKQTLRQYGVAALGTHFVGAVFSVLGSFRPAPNTFSTKDSGACHLILRP